MRYIKSMICVICATVFFASCSNGKIEYMFALYTKDDVMRIYGENTEWFEDIVEIIVSCEEFYDKGRVYDLDDPEIMSPYDENLLYFVEDDQKVIKDFFESKKPYMIYYDNSKQYVTFTFISEDQKDAYSILFWTSNSKSDFEHHKYMQAQDYVIVDLAEYCFMYYLKK